MVVICVVVLVVLSVLFGVVMACANPEWAFDLFGKREKFEILKFLGVGMGGVLLTLQVVMSHKRAKAMETAASAQAEATREQAKANRNTEQGQRQERLKNAIEHLGHGSDSVRLGGAYELVHLAQDTEELRQTVLDILCAHIRRTTGESEYRETYKSKPSEEIQSLLTLLFVQKHAVFMGLRTNLAGGYLQGANLWGARLAGAILTEVRLQGAFLRDAWLQGAFLRDARLQGAFLDDARLQGAVLHSAKLQGANMKNAHLQGASLGWAKLQSADLKGVDLRGARDWAEAKDHKAIHPTFKELIRESIGKPSSLSEVVVEGGLSQEDMDSLVEGLSDEHAGWLRNRLESHIDQQIVVFQLSGNRDASTGMYTKEEAEIWIAEYEAGI